MAVETLSRHGTRPKWRLRCRPAAGRVSGAYNLLCQQKLYLFIVVMPRCTDQIDGHYVFINLIDQSMLCSDPP